MPSRLIMIDPNDNKKNEVYIRINYNIAGNTLWVYVSDKLVTTLTGNSTSEILTYSNKDTIAFKSNNLSAIGSGLDLDHSKAIRYAFVADSSGTNKYIYLEYDGKTFSESLVTIINNDTVPTFSISLGKSTASTMTSPTEVILESEVPA